MKITSKRILIKALLVITLFAGVITACNDDFTEEDALNAQQTIDLSVYVIDFFNTTGLSEVNVSLIQDGNELIATTNEQGIAIFSGIRIGDDIPVTVEREGYTTVQRLIDVNTNNFRQGQITETIGILSLTENTAVVRGKLEIETDVTNDDPEVVPEGTEVRAILDFELDEINEISITATTDAEGNFELVVPATNRGLEYEIVYPTLVLDQTIAKNRNVGEPEFPETLPSLDVISTTFNPRGSGLSVPDNVPTITATVPTPTEGRAIRALVFVDDVSSDGEITDLFISNDGEGYVGDEVSVTITSLFGGSGADITIPIFDSGEFGEISFTETINNGGSGYPQPGDANRISDEDPSFSFFVEVQSGEIEVIDGYYGTGTFRPVDIE